VTRWTVRQVVALKSRRNTFVAGEGVVWFAAATVLTWLLARYASLWSIAVMLPLLLLMFLVFRDPRRSVPPVPLGVVSPVDGVIERIDLTDRQVLHDEAHRIIVRVDALGTYTARAPVEGAIKDLSALSNHSAVDYRTNALWLQTDEQDDVVLQFTGYRFALPPKALVRYGERIGQGQRCAYLRLVRTAEIHLPVESLIQVKPGDRVAAGSDVIAKLPHP